MRKLATRGQEDRTVTEATPVNGWSIENTMAMKRADMLSVLETRFPSILDHHVRQTIENNSNPELLHLWMIAAIRVESSTEFLAVLEE